MEREKQIEEIKAILLQMVNCEKYDAIKCIEDCKKCYATQIYNAGYRKERQGEWISVEDRLPETEGDYLVWNKEQRRIEKRFFYRLPPHYPVESFPEIREYFGNVSDYKKITHWMPLPQPPKMKGAE